MSLPRAVLEAEEKANQLHEELLRQQQQQSENGQQTDQTDEPAPADTQQNDLTPPATTSGSTTPPPEDAIEHRYKVLQGKYNSEVPRLSAENRDLKARLQELEQQFEEMKNAKPVEPLVKPEEIDEYGEGLIDVARRIAREELASKQSEIEKLKREIESVKNVTTTKVSEDFFKSLTELVPDWEQLNEDPNFLAWLEEVDELTGEPRQVLLSRAEQQRNATRTAKFFTAFKQASTSRAATSSQALEQQVVPPTNQAPNTPPSKKVWMRSEIAGFYDRVRRGLISDADAIAIEAEIQAASIEGRIR